MNTDNATRKAAKANITAATARLMMRYGFFAGPLLRKRAIEREDLPTLATDGKDLFYNPAYVATLSVQETMSALVHEVCHDVLLHGQRQGHRKQQPWNVACDKCCNAVVHEMGLPVPPSWIQPVHDSTAEALYKEDEDNNGKGGDCTILQPVGEDGQPLTGQAKRDAEQEGRLVAATFAEMAKRAGKLPASLERVIGSVLEQRAPWQQIVQRFAAENSKAESTWRRPSRRYAARGIVMPSLWSTEVPRFILACDTSGSISPDMLREVGSEVMHAQATCERKGSTELTVLWCDTEVTAQTVDSVTDLKPVGGGGTAFAPVFQWVNDNAPDTRGVVYVTDGYCSDFGPEPSYPVLWVLTCDNPSFSPPFGEIAFTL